MAGRIARRSELCRPAILRVLSTEWDPLGFQGIPELEGEYEAYVPHLVRLVISRAPSLEIFQYLRSVEMELRVDGDLRVTEKTVARLARILDEIDQTLGPPFYPLKLTVEGVVEMDAKVLVLRDDPYCPIRVRTYPELLGGARYVILGAGNTQILELILSPTP